MKQIHDLTGQRFGKLVAIRPSQKRSKNGALMWECQCDCGNTTVVRSGSLVNGNSTSCGCSKRYNLEGQRFGKLLVVGRSEKKDRNGALMWECQCDCGNTTVVRGGSLVSGATKSCGCIRKENMREVHKNWQNL